MGFRLLIVDDSKLARMAVARVLAALNFDGERLEASNADEAVSLLKQAPVDIVLIDFNMPGRDGLHLASDLRMQYPDIVLAVVSANHQQEIVDRARAVGAVFLPKPATEKNMGAFLEGAAGRVKAAGR